MEIRLKNCDVSIFNAEPVSMKYQHTEHFHQEDSDHCVMK